MQKKVLCIFKSPIFQEEALQFALTCASFEFNTTLLFINDGVKQLLKIPGKEILALYDIDTVWVDEQSLTLHRVNIDTIATAVMVLKNNTLDELCQAHDVVFTF